MNNEEYFQSLTSELNSLQNRVRNFIGDHHWLTDGEWKESVLRSVLRRHLPQSIGIGKGFVLKANGEPTTQIDILLYDLSNPILYRDGDLIIITPDTAIGAIEVKTKLRKSDLVEVFSKLSEIGENVGRLSPHRFIGLFSYESDGDFNPLPDLQSAVAGKDRRNINCVSIGNSSFVKYWMFEPPNTSGRPVEKWHLYNLENKAPAYFIYNVIEHLCPQSVMLYNDLWFPGSGKEPNKVAEIERKLPEAK